MLVTFAFRLEIHCPACRMSMPVNGVVPSITCYHCGETHALDAPRWRTTISQERLHEAYFDGPQELSRPNEFELTYRTWGARCEACKGRDLDLVTLGEAVAGTGVATVPCPDCARPVAVRAAGALACAIDPYATLVVGETATSTEHDAKRHPVVFKCEACNAALIIDGSTRMVACRFCEVSNYLPDGLWRQLNPVPKVAQWFLVADYDAEALRTLRWRKGSARFADAMSVTTPPEELVLLSADPSQNVRLAVAKNRGTPPEALERLALDRDADVARAARR